MCGAREYMFRMVVPMPGTENYWPSVLEGYFRDQFAKEKFNGYVFEELLSVCECNVLFVMFNPKDYYPVITQTTLQCIPETFKVLKSTS